MATSEGKAFSSIRIIGSGLIGTSIGLALAARGVQVEMLDLDQKAQKLAQDLIASEISGAPEVILFAIPASALAETLEREFALNPGSKFIDIASVKTKPQVEVSRISGGSSRFLATHPMAGREVGGAASARADLFEGRTWIYCPTFADGAQVDSDVLETGLWLINSLGATPISKSASRHDSAVALVSHLPQIVASLLAAQLKGAKSEDLDLAGAGLRDTTRIAASDPELWQEIISSNAQEILPLLINLQNDLGSLIQSLDDPVKVGSFIAAGNEGRSKIPGKHGGKAREYTQLPVVIEDKPGQLAALFDECAKASVNVEDLTIEHSPGQFTGLITLALSASDASILQKHLEESGWNVHAPR
ncbi:prephenate dehydrogenase [Candidatus Planktophila lacus]|uniref:prephenate dehydrogenase n=1 Tax=Candidatus Planktophila lacus TaxID=1884913 RepID=UPI000BAC598C|nr:prephenate dehydrogenase [Candidatus Planktophila lacus]ASY29018.1 prephenate dehydrogenase [Candidatus Planktophila lacus]